MPWLRDSQTGRMLDTSTILMKIEKERIDPSMHPDCVAARKLGHDQCGCNYCHTQRIVNGIIDKLVFIITGGNAS
jgi:hypothetical protein